MPERIRGEGAPARGRRLAALAAWCAAVVLLIPMKRHWPEAASWASGGACWILALGLAWRDADPAVRRRFGVLAGLALLLAVAPIHTDTRLPHFLTLAAFFGLALLLPTLALRRRDPGVIAWDLLPRRFRRRDLAYALLSVPLAWGVIQVWFFHINPDLPGHWPLPPRADPRATWSLIAGINLVGIWDELFFINTVYGILRSLFPKRTANAAQAVLYSSVLYKMAFTGIGPFVLYGFALTQGAMYEGSRSLLWVLIVHIVVDFFLVLAILRFHYPGALFPGF